MSPRTKRAVRYVVKGLAAVIFGFGFWALVERLWKLLNA